jgi:hypothetical protein
VEEVGRLGLLEVLYRYLAAGPGENHDISQDIRCPDQDPIRVRPEYISAAARPANKKKKNDRLTHLYEE